VAHAATMTARPQSESKSPIPREHGAWGLLLQPFLAAAILANQWTWLLLPALGLILFGFLLREPLIVLARQRFVWRAPNPQTPVAARWLAVESAGALLCLAVLAARLPLVELALLAAAALALTILAVWLTIQNRQRSIPLQIVSAAGLATTALLALLTTNGTIPTWGRLLWGVLSAHGAASILVVHTRLDLKILHRQGKPAPVPLTAYVPAVLQLIAALAIPTAALPLVFSAGIAIFELTRLPKTLDEPLMRVGFRALGVSITHALLTVYALWPPAH